MTPSCVLLMATNAAGLAGPARNPGRGTLSVESLDFGISGHWRGPGLAEIANWRRPAVAEIAKGKFLNDFSNMFRCPFGRFCQICGYGSYRGDALDDIPGMPWMILGYDRDVTCTPEEGLFWAPEKSFFWCREEVFF